jgi:hypothetical protein
MDGWMDGWMDWMDGETTELGCGGCHSKMLELNL